MVMAMVTGMEVMRNLNQLPKLLKISTNLSIISTKNKTKMILVNLKKMNITMKRRVRKALKKSLMRFKSLKIFKSSNSLRYSEQLPKLQVA